MPPEEETPKTSAFERKRSANLAINSALLPVTRPTADQITPRPNPKQRSTVSRKKATPVEKEGARRTSSRLAGIEADSETHKRKAEVEYEFAKEQSRAKKRRVSGDLNISDVLVEGKKWDKGYNFLSGVMRGAQPNQRTFTEDDIKETTDEGLRALREKMSGLQLYEGYEPSHIKITPERVYALGFHPTQTKPLIFAGDKMGNLGLFDASQAPPEVKDEDDEEAEVPEPAITAFKIHSRTITSFVFPPDGNNLYSSSYDSSVRKLDLQKGVAVEVFAPESLDIDLPISSIAIPSTDPNLLFFSTLEGSFGRHDIRTPSDTEIWQLTDKKIGGFSLHPLHPHLFATASLDRMLKIWDLRKIVGRGDDRHPTLLGEHESRLSVSHASWSPAGHVATASYDDTIKIHSFTDAGTFKVGQDLDSDAMAPTAIITHNNQTGRWVTILKPQWQAAPEDGIQKFVIGNMNRFVDVFTADGEQLAQLGGDGITAVPAVAHLHPTCPWVAGASESFIALVTTYMQHVMTTSRLTLPSYYCQEIPAVGVGWGLASKFPILIDTKDDLKKRIARKLTKRRKEGHQATMEIPERFKDGDDADDDCAVLPGSSMNQSVFGMIAAAGSKVDFNARFDGQSSDEDEEDTNVPIPSPASDLKVEKTRREESTEKPEKSEKHHRRKFSENRLIKSIPRLGLKSKSKSPATSNKSPVSSSLEGPAAPEIILPRTPSKDAPVMSRMLEARAELELRPSFDMSRTLDGTNINDTEDGTSSNLAKRLMEIFHFEKAEEVIAEYPCWLLQSVLLQGYMYITTKHICFYAYLPKKSNEVVKSGYLSKSGKRNPKYNRYWFRLKDDVLSYYSNPSELYFPSGNIDLRYGIKAVVAGKDSGKDATHFTVETHQRIYNFKADSIPSAKEWVKALQKIIFRSYNEGDSVKISLPIENIIDIEDSQIIDFADTCKIRVVDDDETFALDEYFFSFFSFGKEALGVLRILVEDTTAQKIPEDLLTPVPPSHEGLSPRGGGSKRNSMNIIPETTGEKSTRPPPPVRKVTPVFFEDTVRATLVPLSVSGPGTQSPRASMDINRQSSDALRRSIDLNKFGRRSIEIGRLTMDGAGRRSMSASRRSLSRNRMEGRHQSEKQGSSDSYVHSLEDPGSFGALPSASDDTQASASQILKGSDVFLSPTIQRSSSATCQRELGDASSTEQFARSLSRTEDRPKPRHAATMGSESSHTDRIEPSGSAPTLQSLVKVGTYPLQRAAGFAGYLNRHSKRMSTLLATESMGYVEKVSGMWKGNKKHYADPQAPMPDDEMYGEDEDDQGSGDRFREHFALPATEKLQATYFGYLTRVLPLYGKIYISNRSFCFRSLLVGTRTKLILPLKDIENVDKEKGFRIKYSGLVIMIKGHEEVFFEFSSADARDDCAITMMQNLETIKYLTESGFLTTEEREGAETASAENKALLKARNQVNMPRPPYTVTDDSPPILFDDPRASILNFKPMESLRITCLTIGSRGDVQPYIALCKGLLAEGHKPKIATHKEFQLWIEENGIEFALVDGDPAELMRICVDNGMFTYSFLKEASSTFRGWLDDLLTSAWAACQNTDLLIESPSAMAGIHIAEALGIPYFRAFSMPWTRTRAYPHAFAVPEHKMGGAYNYISYVMFDNVFWKAIAGQVNRWRKRELGLQATNLEKMQPNKVPFLYNFSPSVVVPPIDFSDWIRVTGYWELAAPSDYVPQKELTDFIQKARDDGKKLVYVGFGSIVVTDSAALTKTVVDSVLKADVRCILSKGWSDRLDKQAANRAEIPLPPEIHQIGSVPHDWLFSQIDAAAHHGGSGTTGASLRAGIPTIIKPFFGDQYFFGTRVEDLGVGITIKKLNVSVFSRALWEASHSVRMITRAQVLGDQIRKEHGVDTAIQSIYRDMEYAKSLIKSKTGKTGDDTLEDSEESWTFIGDDNDPELVRRIHDWENTSQSAANAQKHQDSWGKSEKLKPHDHKKRDTAKEEDTMGKLLRLGTKLKYPITISNVLKVPGDIITRKEPIFQYKFTWLKKVGDPFGEEWDEEQTTIADYDSPLDGNIKEWMIHEGMTVDKDMDFVEIDEECSHAIQFAGLCGICGKDMTEVSWASASMDAERAKINMIHDQTKLTVSETEASRAEEDLQRRLLKNRKLSLVVDLDQTIIHATVDPTVGEWQSDVNSKNYEATQDVKKFQLNEDPNVYYVKFRPGLMRFLDSISELYELHVYTMGTRPYAQSIAKLVDPTKRLFGDRIISRDENGSVMAKSLARLFPVDTKMVVIIDDRADVWPHNRPNLIKVVPFDFFPGIGDINSMYLAKRQDIPKLAPPKKVVTETPENKEPELAGLTEATETVETPEETPMPEIQHKAEEKGKPERSGANDDAPIGDRVSAFEELVRMSGGDDKELLQEQADEQEKLLEKQVSERPLKHAQELLDQEDCGSNNNDNHKLLTEDDDQLVHLERSLTLVHKSFYDEYDSALHNAQGGRVAQLKPGRNKKVAIKEPAADLKIVPDVGMVMPRLKAQVLADTIIVFSGLVAIGVEPEKSEIGVQALAFGASLLSQQIATPKDEELANATSSLQDSDESNDDTDDEEESFSNSQEEQDDEGVMPDDVKGGLSPIDDLKKFDWGEIDDELKEFMGSEEDSDSDSGSDTSSRSSVRNTPQKRKHDELTTDNDDSDGESTLSKKQRIAGTRGTGLKTSKTPSASQSESSLPTPGVTGDENDDGEESTDPAPTTDDFDDDLEADLEKEMMAEFEREEQEARDSGGGEST
ncbi:hypothetical protein B7494_g6572 [Chlorociboria aeruginascens]|nr:hypothetical protein B7494_g6572 [Chlorociboria aeruginascens]